MIGLQLLAAAVATAVTNWQLLEIDWRAPGLPPGALTKAHS